MTGQEPLVGLSVADGIATLRLERPPLNILNLAMMAEFIGALDTLSQDDSVRVVAVTSSLPGVFSAGADVKEHLPEKAPEMIRRFAQLCKTLVGFGKPTVAAVDGKCLGGGMEVALCCDVVLATDRSTFGQPEIALGVLPPVAAALYPRFTGMKNAYWLITSGGVADAGEAARMGLVTKVVDAKGFPQELQVMLSTLAGRSGVALRLAKKALMAGEGTNWDRAIDAAVDIYLKELMASRDATEGLQSFLEKRPPHWQHR